MADASLYRDLQLENLANWRRGLAKAGIRPGHFDGEDILCIDRKGVLK